jgi:hypothetical protein
MLLVCESPLSGSLNRPNAVFLRKLTEFVALEADGILGGNISDVGICVGLNTGYCF